MFYLACGTYKREMREKSLFDDHASNGSTVSGHNRIDISNKTSTRNSMWQSLESNEDELSATPRTLTRETFQRRQSAVVRSPCRRSHPISYLQPCAILSKQRSTHDEHDTQQARLNLFDFDFLARVDHSFSCASCL
jgi:hypothetical protein